MIVSIKQVANTYAGQINQAPVDLFEDPNNLMLHLLSKQAIKDHSTNIPKRKDSLKNLKEIKKREQQKQEKLEQVCNMAEGKCRQILEQFPQEKRAGIALSTTRQLANEYNPHLNAHEDLISSSYLVFSTRAYKSGELAKIKCANSRKVVKEIRYTPGQPTTVKLMNGKEKEISIAFNQFVGSARTEKIEDGAKHVYDGQFLDGIQKGYGEYRQEHTPENTTIHKGLFNEGQLSGYGKITSLDKSYEGEVQNGLPQGIGEFTTLEGVYKGQMQTGRYHGFGTMAYADGTAFTGMWQNGLKHGQGEWQLENVKVIGSWAEGEIAGDVEAAYSNQDSYRGPWGAHGPEGIGTLQQNGLRIEGTWVNGQLGEDVKITFPNQEVYQGKWHNGQKQGQGTLNRLDGVIVSGNWVNDQIEGDVTLTFPNGDIYTGAWHKGKAHGYGTMRCQNGNTFVGNWHKGEKHGQGILTTSTYTYNGQWRFGVRHGQGTETGSNNSYTYVGDWVNGYRHGHGTLLYPGSNEYVGEFKNGMQHGRGVTTYFREGTGNYLAKYDGEYVNGKADGRGIGTYKTGIFEGTYRSGHLLEGTFTYNEDQPQKKYTGEWIPTNNGCSTWSGSCTIEYHDGDVYEGNAQNGHLHGQGTLKNSRGRVLKQGRWENGVFKSATKKF